MRFKHVAIVGVGLIGGSFALAARRAGLAERITGWDRKDALDEARARGVIDGIESAFDSDRVSEADLIYLAAPVGAILNFLRTRANSLKPGAIVTDAGSTKRSICRAAREALPHEVAFVGGHPMAGSERTGVEFADADLFSGAAYALVADGGPDSDAMRAVTQVVSSIGANPIAMTAERHDRIAARISHTPQMLSTALALAVARRGEAETLALAGSGFMEMTRLAESRWSVWEDICRTNADEVSSALDEAIAEIEAVRAAISSGDFAALSEMFGAAGTLMRRFHDQRNHKADSSGRLEGK
ncbi:MAG: prephenate dehydrogenase/arogenate dehydrogenase family protein [Acidobacteriota bacterium]